MLIQGYVYSVTGAYEYNGKALEYSGKASEYSGKAQEYSGKVYMYDALGEENVIAWFCFPMSGNNAPQWKNISDFTFTNMSQF